MNKAMFGGDTDTDLHRHADAAVHAFLAAYRPNRTPRTTKPDRAGGAAGRDTPDSRVGPRA
jgi:hypothetical protein